MQCRIFAASAIGKSHIDAGIPCQDAFSFRAVDDVLMAVVCDGAGSAALSHIGSNSVAKAVVDILHARLVSGEALHQLNNDEFRIRIENIIADARASLELLAQEQQKSLDDYAATLVGVICSTELGYFFHIGDGLAIAQACGTDGTTILSLPENGEYANETYFITGNEWKAHLRITPINTAIKLLALMSDGAAPFVMGKGNLDFYRPFIDPVAKYLDTVSEQEGSEALANTLADSRTYQITSDDKALLIAQWR
jgi:Protein phosphatase 2C